MSAHEPVPKDAALEIRELGQQGYGRNQISYMTGVNSSTVRNVLDGVHKTYDEKLTTRQVQGLITRGFAPIGR
jgi:hypothetical protein